MQRSKQGPQRNTKTKKESMNKGIKVWLEKCGWGAQMHCLPRPALAYASHEHRAAGPGRWWGLQSLAPGCGRTSLDSSGFANCGVVRCVVSSLVIVIDASDVCIETYVYLALLGYYAYHTRGGIFGSPAILY
jgi:hypothetical protein